ncbi:MAG: PTS sugar transporter subunit IIC [bacterium]|nr:MAG: PTS sugar transporter subunit IIC [bacterium]
MSPILAVSLLGSSLAVENRSSINLLISQPISGGFLTGLVLGTPAEGFFIGALFQMMFLGYVRVRGQRIPDLPVGAVTGTALYVLTYRGLGGDPAFEGLVLFWSLFIAILVSGFGGAVYKGWETASWHLYTLARDSVKQGRPGSASALHLSTLLFHFLYGFLILLIVITAGRSFIMAVATSVRGATTGSLDMLSCLVPFIGIGFLLRLHFTTGRIFWFGAGFLASYVFFIVRG